MAKEWKRFFEPSKNTQVYNVSDEVREFAKEYCQGMKHLLKNADGNRPGDKFNFNYIRIPRPNQSKALLAKRKAPEQEVNNNGGHDEERYVAKKLE